MDFGELDKNEREKLGRKIDLARRNAGLTIVHLADRAGYDERTVRNVIHGKPTRIQTLHDICKVVQLDLREQEKQTPEVSGEDHGAYALHHYQDYVGRYYAYRRSFTLPKNLLRTVYEISWDKEKTCLFYKEIHTYQVSGAKRVVSYNQEGEVFISNTVGLIHFLTKYKGAVRLITLTKLRQDDGTMQGIVLTQAERSFYHQPAVSPIFFQKTDSTFSLDEIAKRVGPIRVNDPDYESASEFLAEVERNIAIFALTPAPDHPRQNPSLQIVSSQN